MPLAFKPSEVTKLLKATIAGGVRVGRVEVGKDGKIAIIAAENEKIMTGDAKPLDGWRAARDQS